MKKINPVTACSCVRRHGQVLVEDPYCTRHHDEADEQTYLRTRAIIRISSQFVTEPSEWS